MNETEKCFHEAWLGMVQPVEGLVVSVPVLVDAQCMLRQPPETQQRFLALCPPSLGAAPARKRGQADDAVGGPRAIRDLGEFLAGLLDLTPDLFDAGDALPPDLCLYVPEGRQILRPTMALRHIDRSRDRNSRSPGSDLGFASRYVALVWDLPAGLELDQPETQTGPWRYPPAAKLDRLLRHSRVPIGLLTNRTEVRLIYAPHGESSGHITFRMDDMATAGGRPILDAFVMLLSATRLFGVAEERALPALLAESRKRQASVTSDLSEQVFDALAILLRGFEAAAERDGFELLNNALSRSDDHLYQGLLTVLLRLVFVLYAEDRGLLPVDHPLYAKHMSVLALYERLQADAGAHPDSMSHRFGAWSQLIALFRSVYFGVRVRDLKSAQRALVMPPRRGRLFDPGTYPFLEGWDPHGGAPMADAAQRAAVRVPTVDDGTILGVLDQLIMFQGQRLSYRTLDVEQIGSVYEGLMGYEVARMTAPAVCMRPHGVWITVGKVMAVPGSRRSKWLKDTVDLPAAQADKLALSLAAAQRDEEALAILAEYSTAGRRPGADRTLAVARPGQLVLQPGALRRRTSSHYTPRSLSAPMVRRTLEPLLAAMGEAPASERILHLKVCDPAMGSGAFLVEACRFLADQLVAAWTREGTLAAAARADLHGDPVLHARRLVAQRCLCGVDKNPAAVELAKLSLWLVTLARDSPFTFLDHALRHGDSLVGLSFEQARAFHWQPDKSAQPDLAGHVLKQALDKAVDMRKAILALAQDTSPGAQQDKERLMREAENATARARLIADVVLGAFFAASKDKDREAERVRRQELVRRWLAEDEDEDEDKDAWLELRALQVELRERIPAFHWMLEFPETFYAERPDPLDQSRVSRAAYLDAFVGNPPFMAGNQISGSLGKPYSAWLQTSYPGTYGNADLSAYFFRRAYALLGDHGTIGLLATNTIAQGDTRASGLKPIVLAGGVIYEAIPSLRWPGDANVAVSVVLLAKGAVARGSLPRKLNGAVVDCIDSRLRAGIERQNPKPLHANRGQSIRGTMIYDAGFCITPQQYEELLRAERAHAKFLFPYLGGKEVNTSPTQTFDKYVINFGQMRLEEAEQWPLLLEVVRSTVKPERDNLRNNAVGLRRKELWWQFGGYTPALFQALEGKVRCLVTARVSKHLIFSFQPTDRVLSEQLYVFPIETFTCFAVLQSRPHDGWARLLSSSMRMDMRYTATDCFETFPFPQPDPRAVIPALEDIGRCLYEARAAYMLDTEQGLTKTYNALKDPACRDQRILMLRRLHEEMDAAVLAAYGWNDIPVPPYCPAAEPEKTALEAFRNEVIDRLFALNAKRAGDEERRGLGLKPASPGKGKPGRERSRESRSTG